MTADSDRFSHGGGRRNSPADVRLSRAFNEWLITRVRFFPGTSADSDHFNAESYYKVQRMLLSGVWHQLCEDPSAFGSDRAGETRNDGAERSEIGHDNEHEDHHLRLQHRPPGELAQSSCAVGRALVVTSQVDTSKTFFSMQQIMNTLRILAGPRNAEQDALFYRKDAFIASTKGIIESRRLFLTNGNYLGLGARSAQIGDQVWILSGPSTPFIMRPTHNDRYKLMGEAYVHGIMHGEAVAAGGIDFGDIELE